jgi:hypothetical protein
MTVKEGAELVARAMFEAGFKVDPPEKSPQSLSLYVGISREEVPWTQLRVSDHELPSLRARGSTPYDHIFTKDWKGATLSEEEIVEQVEELIEWLRRRYGFKTP